MRGEFEEELSLPLLSLPVNYSAVTQMDCPDRQIDIYTHTYIHVYMYTYTYT